MRAQRFEAAFFYLKYLSWSPDNQTLVFAAAKRDQAEVIYTLNIASGMMHSLTPDTYDHKEPAWSPDGSYIAFVSDRDGATDIFVMDNDGTDIRNLSQSSGYDFDPVWSPDGSQIAFTTRDDNGYDLMLVNVESGESRQLTNGDFINITGLAWKP